MKLRYYQNESIQATFNYFEDGNRGNPINVLPTGTGKSVIIAQFIKEVFAQYPGSKVMMLTHVKELIEQNFDKLRTIWPTAPAGVYSAGLKRRDTDKAITYAGVASVAKRALEFGHVDLVLVDECDLISPNRATMYRKFITALKNVNPHLKVIGYTATPYRLGTGMLTEAGLFTDVCYDLSTIEGFNRLIAEGFLSPLIPKRTTERLDLEDVGTSGGDYIQKQLQEAVDKEEITRAALKEILELGNDRKHWLIFATGIEHSEHIVEELERMNIPALAVHSKLKTDERDKAIVKFKSGEIRAVVNNNVLTTGFDFPDIDLIAVLRPTKSARLWVQMLGRGTRPCAGKENCLVLDFAGNTMRLGPINDPVLPTPKGTKGGGSAPIRCCEECSTYVHASVKVCPVCGFTFPVKVKLSRKAGEGELISTTDFPVMEMFKVTAITYSKHQPRDKRAPSLKVTYLCGLRTFTEWVTLEHASARIRSMAKRWWLKRDPFIDVADEAPEDITEAQELSSRLLQPSAIKVWINRKYPEIVDHVFDAVKKS